VLTNPPKDEEGLTPLSGKKQRRFKNGNGGFDYKKRLQSLFPNLLL